MGLNYSVSVIATRNGDDISISPARDRKIYANTALALIGTEAAVQALCDTCKLERTGILTHFSEVLTPSRAGISEIVIPPNSGLIGKSLQQIRMRRPAASIYWRCIAAKRRHAKACATWCCNPATPCQHSTWNDLAAVDKNHRDFLVVTADVA